MKRTIEQLIKSKGDIYRDNYAEMLGDYYGELETIKGYNGRQILELLQNCDDEGAKEVLIKLDSKSKKVSISNNGTPFSEKGYRSLFIANLSSKKSKRKYIGNKGLGFRSIINWAAEIEIHSNDLLLIYSEEGRRKWFHNLFNLEERETILKEERMKMDAVPIPFLCMPLVKQLPNSDFVTSINITYKPQFYQSIVDQVSSITPETLLFLRHIEKVKFDGFEGVKDISCKKSIIDGDGFIPVQTVRYDQYLWNIFSVEGDLPDDISEAQKEEQEFYQIKIAVEEKFQKTSPYLYSFFPTHILLKQPYILHATFDLDSTRNQVISSKKNEFILKKVVEFTIRVAKYYSGERVNYRPLQILSYKHKSDTLDILGYYDLIKEAIDSEAVFPCIDNTYKSLDEVMYVSDGFGSILKEIGASEVMGYHILPLNDKALSELIEEIDVDRNLEILTNAVDMLNELAALNMSHIQRATFISEVIKNGNFIKTKFKNQLNILVSSGGGVIDGGEYIYTPVTQSKVLKIPSYAKVQFINRNLFNELVNVLRFKENENSNKGRFIYEQLEGFCNIHSYEPAALAEKLVSEANNAVVEKKHNSLEVIKELHECLYYNFNFLDAKGNPPVLRTKVPCISKGGALAYATDLIISEGYPSGKLTHEIFTGIYSDEDYVADPISLGLGINELGEVERYLFWVGVNRFASYYSSSLSNSDYVAFVLRSKGITTWSSISISTRRIKKFEDILNSISLNKLVLWIYHDEELKKQIDNQKNDDIVSYSYYTTYQLSNKASFIKYLICKIYPVKFDDLLLDEIFAWTNDVYVDYAAKEFSGYEISKSSINEILVKLGAFDEFNNLPVDRIAAIINKVPDVFKDGKSSQAIYKKALAYYKIKKTPILSSLKLFADSGNGLAVFENKRVYFSDRIKLPSRLKSEFPIFNFPSRSGGAEAVTFFGIKDLKSINIKITSYQEFSELTQSFDDYFAQIKPLLLSIRINDVEERGQQKNLASICGRITIIFCQSVSFEVEGKKYKADDFEFLHLEDFTYLVNVPVIDDLAILKKNPQFLEVFADIISLSFDITSEKGEYKQLLRNEFEEALTYIKSDYGEDAVKYCRELLGQADYKIAFWNAVFQAKGNIVNQETDELSLQKLIEESLGIVFDTTSINYSILNTEFELLKIKELFSKINITLSEFALLYPYQISMEAIHAQRLKDIILGDKRRIKNLLWKQFSVKEIEEQVKFLSEINRFENYFKYSNEYALRYKSSFELPEKEILDNYVTGLYGLLSDEDSAPDAEEIKQANLRKLKEDDVYRISLDEQLRSLIYFPQRIDYILERLTGNDELEEIDDLPERSTKTTVSIVSSERLKPQTAYNSHVFKKSGIYTPKAINGKKNKLRGITSERIVYDYMVKNKYLNVVLVSHDNEGLHYDIRYTNKEGIVKYVEVKTFDSDSFIMSAYEYDFGFKNKRDYEVWLVKDQSKIIPIKDFFDNVKYRLYIKDYIVYLQLDT